MIPLIPDLNNYSTMRTNFADGMILIEHLKAFILDLYKTANLELPSADNFNPVIEVIRVVLTLRGEQHLIEEITLQALQEIALKNKQQIEDVSTVTPTK
jgi:hypothetical protein